MTSLSLPGTIEQLVKPEYNNWLALGHALTTLFCKGVRSFIAQEMKIFQANLSKGGGGTCTWKTTLESWHHKRKPNWRQSDAAKWTDPVLGPWEIAKLFLPDLGGHVDIKSAEDLDIAGILNLMYWCNHFTIPQYLIKDVRKTRNDNWVHVAKLEISDEAKNDAFDAIEKLLRNPQLAANPDARNALGEIEKLRKVSDLKGVESLVLTEFKSLSSNLIQKSEITLEQLKLVELRLERLEQQNRPASSFHSAFQSLCSLLRMLVVSFKGTRRGIAVPWMMMSLFLGVFVVLDQDTYIKDGCSLEMYSDPWGLKHFDFRDFINSSRAEFTGRNWLYREIESVLTHSNKRGVLLTGNPGSGKSAFLSNLLYSNTSSPIIHRRILAYHFCMHLNAGTKVGASFVRNTANMIAWRVTDYRQVILTDLAVRRVLYKDCPLDPEWCFEMGILNPLRNIPQQPVEPWYIVIDALDECVGAKAEILNILKYKISQLPNWLKLIVSSRNVSTIAASLNELERVDLRSDDQRNLDDINSYIFMKTALLKDTIAKKIKTALAIVGNDKTNQEIVSNLAERGQGNFQYIKVVLDLWLSSTEGDSWDTFPKTLDNSYEFYFERKYSAPDSFLPLRQIFEVIVAAYKPLTIHEMYSLLTLEHPTLDLEYDLMPKIDQVSLFLWHGLGDGLIRIHHASLSEWLTSENNRGKFYYIKKKNGHKLLAKHYLNEAERNNMPLKPDAAFHLACHVVEGGLDKDMERRFLSLPSDHVNTTDSVTQVTALHHSASFIDASVTRLLLHHVDNVDCLDGDHRTPSFIAATSGRLNNLKILHERGANLNYTITYAVHEMAFRAPDPVSECKRKWCNYSLLHTAAQKGNIDVVNFLVEHELDILKTTGTNNTAIQLAAENGHIETMQALKKAGGELDIISLHHASAGGHDDIVQYILREGIRDDCIQEFPSIVYPDRGENKRKRYLYDNSHLFLRETALHAAVRNGHLSVIELLMSEDQTAINCTNSAGRSPLHEAVHKNSYNVLNVLLSTGADGSVQCSVGNSLPFQQGYLVIDEAVRALCPCGFSALHIAAMYGLHRAATLLLKHGVDVNARDCTGATPLHIASCHEALSLITLLVENGADVNAPSLNGSTPLHSGGVCLAKASFRRLFDLGCDHYITDDEGMTALHYIVKDLDTVGSEYFLDLYAKKPKDWIGNEEAASQLNTKIIDYPWLSALVELVRCSAKTKTIKDTFFFGMADNKRQSAWDVLAQRRTAPYILMGSKSFDKGRFVQALTPLTFSFDITFNEIQRDYESSVITKFLKRFLIKTIITIFPESMNCSLLLNWVSHNLVHTINTLLQAGIDVNCRDVSGLTPLLVYLRTGGRHMSKVFVKHKVEMDIACGVPFESSVFHLASFHKFHYLHYLSEFLQGKDNWQNYLESGDSLFDYFVDSYEENESSGNFETLRTGDGPLTSAILSHPKGKHIIDECYDADGYNVLHRAAQGSNVIAIRKFLSFGANPFLKDKNGFSSLWLSVLYAVKYKPFFNPEMSGALTALEVELASFAASAILSHVLRYRTTDIGCDRNNYDLTLYHVAAMRGMWRFVEYLLSEKRIIGINVDCPNKDGITPMYLAKFIGGDSCRWDSPWCKVVYIIKGHGGTLKYPTLEAEYFLFHMLHCQFFPRELFPQLTYQEIENLRLGNEHDCNCSAQVDSVDVFGRYEDFHTVLRDYKEKHEECVTLKKNCPIENLGLPHLTYVLFKVEQNQGMSDFFSTRNCFVDFLDDELQQVRDHLLNAIDFFSEITLNNTSTSLRQHMLKIGEKARQDPLFLGLNRCSFYEQPVGLHHTFINYKLQLEFMLDHSHEIRSDISRTLPSFLAKMDSALRNLERVLYCDKQAVSIKYIQLEFYLRCLHNIWQILEKSSYPVVETFQLERIKKAFREASTESLKLLLKLSSWQPHKSFRYLKILIFPKPPLWENEGKKFYE